MSVATFAVGSAYLVAKGLEVDGQMALFLVLLEIPGILVGIWLGRARAAGTPWGPLLREIFLSRSVLLLV